MEDAEHQRACAHAQCQHHGAENGQSRIALQSAQRLPQLRPDRLQCCAQANVANLILDLFRSAEFEEGRAPRRAWIGAGT